FRVVEGGLHLGQGIEGESRAGGIGQALVTTAAGLAVAIPATIIHHYLSSRVEEFVEALERSVADLVSCLVPLRSRSAEPRRRASVAEME
ncbi:MAG: MotA/TolQ/ExbB proton channel family protein, partial [Planctomycetota bacterium]